MNKISPSLQAMKRIAQSVPTPFHLYDRGALIRRAQGLNQAFAWNPAYREYFAVKATPNPYLLEILKAQGCGVDCASLTELMLARAVGFQGEQIMFSSNETPAEEFRLARELSLLPGGLLRL